MKLYEIADEYQRMLAVMEEYEMPEDVIQNTLECIQDDADQKMKKPSSTSASSKKRSSSSLRK